MEDWFDINQINGYLYVIREKLDLIDNRFHTQYTNLYLILGTHTAILFDTGSGYGKIKRQIDKIVEQRELLVINSHNHFDHVGGNIEFPSVYIHHFDLKRLTTSIDVSFLKTSSSIHARHFANYNYHLESSSEHQLLIGDEKFDLGGIDVTIISTPGHTPGSICLLTSRGDLFTGDTVHFGAVYLPFDDLYNNYKQSLLKLKSMVDAQPDLVLYPAHEEFGMDGQIILKLLQVLENLPEYNEKAKYDEFLESYWIDYNGFKIIFPKDYKF